MKRRQHDYQRLPNNPNPGIRDRLAMQKVKSFADLNPRHSSDLSTKTTFPNDEADEPPETHYKISIIPKNYKIAVLKGTHLNLLITYPPPKYLIYLISYLLNPQNL